VSALLRRRILIAGLAAAAFFATLPSSADYWEIRKAGRLRVLVLEGAPELFGWKAVQAPGLEREILQSFGRLEHLDLEIRSFASSAALFHALEKGEGDLAAGGLTPADNQAFEYSAEVLPSRDVVVTWKRAQPLARVEELAEEKVGTIRGTALAEVVSGAGVPAAKIDDGIAPGGLIAALKSGRVSACVVGIESALPAKAVDPELQIGPYVGAKHSLAFAIRKDEPKLRESINGYINNMRRTATWNRLVLKYFGDSTVEILKASR
jgi:ABC-type amino acid transport substrate-binding protein